MRPESTRYYGVQWSGVLMRPVYHPLRAEQAPVADIFFNYEAFLPNTITPKHSHVWGAIAADQRRYYGAACRWAAIFIAIPICDLGAGGD